MEKMYVIKKGAQYYDRRKKEFIDGGLDDIGYYCFYTEERIAIEDIQGENIFEYDSYVEIITVYKKNYD